MHKYLNKLGVRDDDICTPGTTDDDGGSERMKMFRKEREEYGFDSRETWALEFTAALWLYEHLKMYKKKAGKMINLSFHKFRISEIKVDPKVWETREFGDIEKYISVGEEKEMTQEEAIDLCCRYLKHYIKTEKRQKKACKKHGNSIYVSSIQETIDAYESRQAFHIFAEISPAMWW